MKFKNAQIGIFIILAIIIVIGMISMIFFSFEFKEDIIEENIQDTKDDNLQNKLAILKNTFISCLEINLKKALLLSAYKGGFIYTNNDYESSYLNEVSSKYTDDDFKKINLLDRKTLVHNFFCSPKLDSSCKIKLLGKETIIYNKSIGDEIKKYIELNFLSCIDFEEFEKRNKLKVDFTDNFGSLETLPEKKGSIWVAKAKNFEVKNNHRVILNTDENEIGIVTIGNNGEKFLKFKKKPNFPIEKKPEEIGVINLNLSFNLDLDFQENAVLLKVNNPITLRQIEDNSKVASFEEISTKINLPYKSFLKIAEKIKAKKYITKQDLISNLSILNEIIKSEKIKVLNDIKLIRTNIKTDEEHKIYIYSIYSDEIRLSSLPFYFNFAYENKAPFIIQIIGNFEETEISQENKSLFIKIKKSVQYEDAKFIGEDKDIYDSYFLGNFLYEIEPLNSLVGTFVMDEKGLINYLKANKKGIYTYYLYILDGETKRRYYLKIEVI
jgi:hypothetical protein